jgi:hypothetical protein
MAGEPYTKAMIMTAPVIAGVRLRPLSCWHLVALRALGCAYACGGLPTAQDMATTLLVCASRWTGDPSRDLRAWLRFCDGGLAAWMMAARLAVRDPRKINAALAAHIEASVDAPIYLPQEGSRASHVDFAFRTAARLVSLGHSECAAWNMPYVRAACYVAAADEREGAKLLSADEMDRASEAIDAMDRMVG